MTTPPTPPPVMPIVLRVSPTIHKHLLLDCTEFFSHHPTASVIQLFMPLVDGTQLMLRCTKENKVIDFDLIHLGKQPPAVMT